MKVKIDWANQIVEFFVVIIGIVIAFQLSQYAVFQEQKEVVKEHLSSIKDEVKYNRQNLNRSLKAAISVLQKLDSLILLIKEDGDLATVNALALQTGHWGGGYLKQNAYKSFTDSGDIRYLKDFKLRNQTVFMYEYYNWIDKVQMEVSSQLKAGYLHYLHQNLDFLTFKLQNKEVYFAKEYTNGVLSYKLSLDFVIARYEECLKKSKLYLATVDKYLMR